MYQPADYREERLAVLHALIRAHPLGTLVTHDGALLANLVPFLLVEDGEWGVLRGHVARANDQLPALRAGAETLVVFQGPQAYVSPGWYASKAAHGRVVPTWNYVTVQVQGVPRVTEDAAWLRAQVDALTAQQEHGLPHPWAVADAPADYVAAQLKGIVGVEIPIAAIAGKWKASQNKGEADRAGVRAGLAAGGCPMAGLIPG